MRLVEAQQDRPLEEVLLGGTTREVARKVGINYSTVSKWRKQLGLRYAIDNLPGCDGCPLIDLVCQTTGQCHVLVRARALPEVVETKRVQVMREKME